MAPGASPAPASPGRSVVFYTPRGFSTILNAVKQNNNPANSYYFTVGGPIENKTAVRPDPLYQQISGAAANMHPLAEFNLSAWAHKPGTWLQKGEEFRQEMAAAGLAPNTEWDINEAGSGMRAKSDADRNHLINLIKGLYHGSNGMAADQGFVFQQGPGYSQGLKHFLGDTKFWGAIKQAVKAYMPETYASPVRFEHQTAKQQRNYLLKALANPELKGPMMSAYWGDNSGYGNTYVPLGNMEHFVNREAKIASSRPVEGFAWNGVPKGKSTTETTLLAQKLAAAAAGR